MRKCNECVNFHPFGMTSSQCCVYIFWIDLFMPKCGDDDSWHDRFSGSHYNKRRVNDGKQSCCCKFSLLCISSLDKFETFTMYMDYATCACWLYSTLCKIYTGKKGFLSWIFYVYVFSSSLLMFHYKRETFSTMYIVALLLMHESFFDSLHTRHEKNFFLRIFHDFACMIMINFMRCCFLLKIMCFY